MVAASLPAGVRTAIVCVAPYLEFATIVGPSKFSSKADMSHTKYRKLMMGQRQNDYSGLYRAL